MLVTLLTPTGTLTTTTDANGNYMFTGLISGTYQVQFTPPAGYTFTLPGTTPTSGTDSNVNTFEGVTPPVTINVGETNPTIDAGLWLPASLGDTVWFDIDKDGKQDPSEPGLPGVVVSLIVNGQVVATTTTNISGTYGFTGLTPGLPYVLEFSAPNGYAPTVATGGLDDVDNSDVDPGTLRTQPVVLTSGQHNPKIDAGFITTVGLGNFVWLDVDRDGVQDPGEPGIPGVPVMLFENGVPLSTTVTGPTGGYQFIELLPGVPYTVSFGLPSGYTWTVETGSLLDPANSDARPDGSTPPKTLVPGEFDGNIDAGVWITPNVTLVKSALNQGAVKSGTQIRYQLTVRNAGPTLSRNVVLTDPIPTGTTYVAGSVTSNGVLIDNKLEWRIGDMQPGDAVTVTFAVKVDENLTATTIRNTAVLMTDERTIVLDSNEVQNPTSPTAVTLDKFEAVLDAVVGRQSSVVVKWATALELNTLGFDLYRSETANRADAVKVNAAMFAAKGTSGGTYEFVDAAGSAQSRYWLVETELSGNTVEYGPALVGAPGATVGNGAQTTVASVALVPAIENRGLTTVAEARAGFVPQTQAVVAGNAVAIVPAAPAIGAGSACDGGCGRGAAARCER